MKSVRINITAKVAMVNVAYVIKTLCLRKVIYRYFVASQMLLREKFFTPLEPQPYNLPEVATPPRTYVIICSSSYMLEFDCVFVNECLTS